MKYMFLVDSIARKNIGNYMFKDICMIICDQLIGCIK